MSVYSILVKIFFYLTPTLDVHKTMAYNKYQPEYSLQGFVSILKPKRKIYICPDLMSFKIIPSLVNTPDG